MFEFRPPAVVQADAELTLALRSGDEAAVRELFERYGALVHAIALSGATGVPAADPGQITLHVFLQAWRNSEVFESGRSFAPWLATLARSVCVEAGCPVSDGVVDGLLAGPADWVEPPAGLEERVVAAVISEAHVDPSEIYTAADLAAAASATSQRSTTIRSVVIGVVGGLVLVLGGIFLLSAMGGSSEPESTTVELRPTGRVPDAAGSIEVVHSSAGLTIGLEASPLPDVGSGGMYRAVVALDDGTVVPAGSFTGGDDDIDLILAAAVPEGDGDQFLIVIATSDSPTDVVDDSDVVLRAPLP